MLGRGAEAFDGFPAAEKVDDREDVRRDALARERHAARVNQVARLDPQLAGELARYLLDGDAIEGTALGEPLTQLLQVDLAWR